jgi:Fic family protein
MKKPPFTITSKITNLVADISKLLGGLEATTLSVPNPNLRRKNKIKTIKSTLAIEGHTFTEDQITAVLENKRVLGNQKEILEVKNALDLYDSVDSFKSKNAKDFLKAHKVLMSGLVKEAGKYRSKNVGVLAGTKVKHLAPKPDLVPELMRNVFEWIKKEKDLHSLILSSVVHYEIEFIHPFEDGNGRMGRFWQGLILKEHDNFFRYVPIESLIEKNQKEYYETLEKSDNAGDSTLFIEYMLGLIKESLEEMAKDIIAVTNIFEDRMAKARSHFEDQLFSRKDYMELFKNISSATASRDLKDGVVDKLLKKSGERNQTRYNFK